MSASVTKTQGIILHRYAFGETDQIFVLMTQALGKISCFVRGARVSQRRFGGKLDLFCQGTFIMSPPKASGRGLWMLQGAEGLTHALALRKSISALSLASYLCECVEHFAPPEDPHELLYTWLVGRLAWIAEQGHVGAFDSVRLETELLQLCGYRPHWQSCQGCGGELQVGQAYFSFDVAGTICPNCPKAGFGRWIPVDAVGQPRVSDLDKALGEFSQHVLGKALRTRALKEEVIDV